MTPACAVETAPAHDQAVIAELWISFASLLRSHLAALKISGRMAQAVFAAIEEEAIEIVDLSRTLRIERPLPNAGAWSLTRLGEPMATGRWRLAADASVMIDGWQTADMELGVEAFAGKLWQAQPAAPTPARNEA